MHRSAVTILWITTFVPLVLDVVAYSINLNKDILTSKTRETKIENITEIITASIETIVFFFIGFTIAVIFYFVIRIIIYVISVAMQRCKNLCSTLIIECIDGVHYVCCVPCRFVYRWWSNFRIRHRHRNENISMTTYRGSDQPDQQEQAYHESLV